MSDRARTQEQFLEIVLILISLGLCVLFYRIDGYRVVVLNLFYLPVVLAAFFLGRYRAGVLALLCAVGAAGVTAWDLGGFAVFTSPVMVGLAMTIWAAVLALTTILTGTLSDERLQKTAELHDAYVGVVEVLSQYLNNADKQLNAHSTLNSRLAQQVAARLNLSDREIDDIRIATLLQDMESIEVTTRVIRKAIGSLAHEKASQHTFHGGDLAQSLGRVLRGALPLLVEHDRHFDPSGAGADDDLVANAEAPMGAHVIRTVRCYLTLVHEQPGDISPAEALDILENDTEEEHHPAVLHALKQVVLDSSADTAQPENPEPQLAGTAH